MLPRHASSSPVRIDFFPAESSGEVSALGDADIIADGGTEVMRRSSVIAEAAVPPAPVTRPMLELGASDREDEPRIERTQPFDRASLFSHAPSMAPAVMNPYPPLRSTFDVPAVRYAPSAKLPFAIAAAIVGVLVLCAAVFVTIAVRTIVDHRSSTDDTSTVVAAPREAQSPASQEDNGIPVVSPEALPSAPYAPHGGARRPRSSR